MYGYYTMGKYWYNNLPMGVRNSRDILKLKIRNLFQGFEFMNVCIDEILVMAECDWKYSVQKLKLTLNKRK